MKPHFSVVVLLIGLNLGCKKLPEYAIEPEISFNRIEVFRDYYSPNALTIGDSVIVTVNFKDGDGDLGIPYDDITTSDDNYFLEMEKMVNGTFEELDFGPGFTFNGKFPQLAPSNVISPIDGELDYSIFLYHSAFSINDTLRFTIYIVDRDNNKSNTVVTDDFIVKKL